MSVPPLSDTCFNLFHSQACHGFGAPEFCPECGESWTASDRARRVRFRQPPEDWDFKHGPEPDPHGGYIGDP